MNSARQRHSKIQLFKSKLSKANLSLIDRFEIVLTATEIEFRSKNVKDQNSFMRIRHSLQKIATQHLNVEVALYDSVYSNYPNNRVGVFLSID